MRAQDLLAVVVAGAGGKVAREVRPQLAQRQLDVRVAVAQALRVRSEVQRAGGAEQDALLAGPQRATPISTSAWRSMSSSSSAIVRSAAGVCADETRAPRRDALRSARAGRTGRSRRTRRAGRAGRRARPAGWRRRRPSLLLAAVEQRELLARLGRIRRAAAADPAQEVDRGEALLLVAARAGGPAAPSAHASPRPAMSSSTPRRRSPGLRRSSGSSASASSSASVSAPAAAIARPRTSGEASDRKASSAARRASVSALVRRARRRAARAPTCRAPWRAAARDRPAAGRRG